MIRPENINAAGQYTSAAVIPPFETDNCDKIQPNRNSPPPAVIPANFNKAPTSAQSSCKSICRFSITGMWNFLPAAKPVEKLGADSAIRISGPVNGLLRPYPVRNKCLKSGHFFEESAVHQPFLIPVKISETCNFLREITQSTPICYDR